MKDLISLLQNTQLFEGIPDEILLHSILPHASLHTYQKDQFLIVPQQMVDRIGIVVSGKVHIMHLFENGSRSLMSVIAAGSFVGTDLICTRSRLAPYHAVAAAPAQLLYLPAELLLQPGMLEDGLRMSCLERLLTLISQENIKKEYRLAILSQNGLRDRIITYLTMQAQRRQTNTFTIPFSRDEMASFLCVNRSALSHELSLMQQEGLISFRKNVFTLHIQKHAVL